MNLSPFEFFLIVSNALSFLLYALYARSRRSGMKKLLRILLILITVTGGALGTMVYMILFDRRADKETMMFRVVAACMLVIQGIGFLAVNGALGERVSLDVFGYLGKHPILLSYLAAVNGLTWIAFALDKYKAVKQQRRIRIVVLLGLAMAGGAVGALIGMYAFRHKIRQDYFFAGVPLMLAVQMMLLIFVMNIRT